MTDAALVWLESGGDIKVESGDLLSDDGLITAVILSLFVDARADVSQLPFGENGQRGYWADNEQDRHGSLLWLLGREKVTDEIVARAQAYAKDALMWLCDDGIAGGLDVKASRQGIYAIGLKVQILQGNNREYQYLWDALKNTTLTIGETTLEIEFI